MSFNSFEEQFKTVILEYLSPDAYSKRLKKSTEYTNADRGEIDPVGEKLRNKGATRNINKLSKIRNKRVAKVRKGRATLGDKVKSAFGVPGEKGPRPTRLKKKGFDAVAKSGPKATMLRGESPDKDALGKFHQRSLGGRKERRPYSRRLSQDPQARSVTSTGRKYEEQFRNAILNYLNEGLPNNQEKPKVDVIKVGAKRVSAAAKKAKKSGQDPVEAADRAVARIYKAGDKELDRSDEISAEGAGKVAGRFQRAVITGQKKTDKSGKNIQSQVGRIRKKFDKRKPAVNRNDGGIKYSVPGDADTFDAARTTVGKDDNEPLVRALKRKPI